MEYTCNNPACGKTYESENTTDGFCSFECWSAVHCNTPKSKKEETEEYDMTPILTALVVHSV
jgi:hypothetical protein